MCEILLPEMVNQKCIKTDLFLLASSTSVRFSLANLQHMALAMWCVIVLSPCLPKLAYPAQPSYSQASEPPHARSPRATRSACITARTRLSKEKASSKKDNTLSTVPEYGPRPCESLSLAPFDLYRVIIYVTLIASLLYHTDNPLSNRDIIK